MSQEDGCGLKCQKRKTKLPDMARKGNKVGHIEYISVLEKYNKANAFA